MDKVLIAMSGGVDSSVAAFLMKEQGCECIGATMKLFHNEDIGVSRTKTCCSLEDVEDARLVALRLGIPYYAFNFSDDFKGQVIDRFISSYERGATPNPCIDCNRYLKFERLYERARILGCDAIVTGHYARIEQENGRWLLKKSLDESKDQSYVLYSLTQDQLAHTRLPLGAMHKSETRRIAEEQGFYNADKPDSQDICFVPDGDYAGFIARYTGRDCPAGDFVDESGRVLGRHKGIVHYTVGQRKGLGIAADAPLYVKRIDAAENRVVLSGNDALFSRELMANDFNWIAYDVPPRELRATARVRYHQREQAATVTVLEDGHVHLVFDEPQRAATPGQAAVFYDGELHKLGDVHFNIPKNAKGREDYLKPWTFTSDDNRFYMDFTPVLDRSALASALIVQSNQHQVFGRFTGRVTLDDGTVLPVRDFFGFAEKVENRW